MVEAEYSLIRTEGSRDYILIATAYLCEHPEQNQKNVRKRKLIFTFSIGD